MRCFSLLFLYLPFLLMQFSYKFYVIANFYYFMSHQAYVTSAHFPVPKADKNKAYQSSYYNPSHLTLDKRYQHKINSENDSYCAEAPAPAYVEIKNNFIAGIYVLVTSSYTISTPRAPPCA